MIRRSVRFPCALLGAAILLASASRPAFAADEEAEAPPGKSELQTLIDSADDLRLRGWQEGKALEAIPLYEKARELGADPFEVEWKIASSLFWAGENVTESRKLESLGTRCLDHAEKAAKLEPERVEGHYYTAVCWGTYSHGISIPSAILKGVEGKFKAAAEKAEKIDPSFENGAPLNAWGRFYFELPWPKRDLAKSKKYLKRNFEVSPCNLRTRLYYAESVLKDGGKVDGKPAKEAAREHLQFVLDGEWCSDNPGDGALSKKLAARLLKDL